MSYRTCFRARPISAFRSQQIWIQNLLTHCSPRPKGLHVRQLDAHLARDIGLSDAALERHRFRLPSQTEHHPRG